MHVSKFDKLFEIITHVRPLVIAARFELACGDFMLADIEQQKCLDRINLDQSKTLGFVLDHVKEQTVKTLDKRQGVEITRHKGRILCGHWRVE